MGKLSMSYLFSFSRYQTKYAIETDVYYKLTSIDNNGPDDSCKAERVK